MEELKYLQEVAQTTIQNLLSSNNVWLMIIAAFVILYLAKSGNLSFLGVNMATSELIEEILDSDWVWIALIGAAVLYFTKNNFSLYPAL